MTDSLWVPGHWPSLNVLITRGKFKYETERKGWHRIVALHARTQGVPANMGPRFISFFHARKDRRTDPDNFAGFAQKMVLDAVLGKRSDGWDYVLGLGHQWVVHKKSPGLLVMFDEIDTRRTAEQFRALLSKAPY